MIDTQPTLSRIAVVYGVLPSVEEIDQLELLEKTYSVTVITSESIVGYLTQNSFSSSLNCIPLPDHDENPGFLPGLEKSLEGFELVICKERLGMYAFQTVKAKWKFRFRLIIWIDNLNVLPAEDVQQIRIIRNEATNAADAFIVQSEPAKQTLEAEGISSDKIYKWSSWVPVKTSRNKSERQESLTRLKLSYQDIIISYRGQIEWEEGLLDLIHAIKIVKDRDSSMHRLKIIICGIGSFASELKQRALRLGIDNDILYLAPNRETYCVITHASDASFIGGHFSRDRADGDPYKIIASMTNRIPIIAPRTPIVEEQIGKHRLDYCLGSPHSIAKAICKLVGEKKLVNNIVSKNFSIASALNSEDKVVKSMTHSLYEILKNNEGIRTSEIDEQVSEVERKIAAGQYLSAIELIEIIFGSANSIPSHHKSNLYRLIGDCFTKLGDSEAGKSSYIQAIEIDPYAWKAHVGLGTVSLTKSNFDIAIIHFQRAVSLAPNDEMANLGLGLSFHGLDELKEAHKWVLKSLELNPENTAAIYTLVKIGQERGTYQDSEAVLEAYLRLHPNDFDMTYTLAGILFRLEKYEEVIHCLQGIVSSNPMDARAQSLVKQSKRALERSERSAAG